MTIPKTESDKVEFKQGFSDTVIETIVAFSNNKGGKIYLGVNDNGEISGIAVGKDSITKYINTIKQKTNPSVIPDIYPINENGKEIICIDVMESNVKPVCYQGIYFKRINASNHQLSVDEISNMHLRTINSSWDMCHDQIHNFDDVSFEKIKSIMVTLKNKGFTINDDPFEFLMKYNLTRDEKLTNAAFLLFKKDQPCFTTIELSRCQDRVTVKDSARTKSDILTQVEEVFNFVKKHLNMAIISSGEPYNKQVWQYPLDAIREIILNMVVHRNYHSSSDSDIKIYDDKIEFYNPGRLSDSISIDDLFNNSYRSNPRNKLIAELFKDLGLIEKYGSGISKIIKSFKEAELPMPHFQNITDGFMVTVFSKPFENVGVTENILESNPEKYPEKYPENSVIKLTEVQYQILNLIRLNQNITINNLSSQTKITVWGIKKNLTKLKKLGFIERIGPDKGGYWRVKKI